jgi:hypothetical protein
MTVYGASMLMTVYGASVLMTVYGACLLMTAPLKVFEEIYSFS